MLALFGQVELNEENSGNQNNNTKREYVTKLQSKLKALVGIINENATSTNGLIHNGGYLFSLFQRAEVFAMQERHDKFNIIRKKLVRRKQNHLNGKFSDYW